MPKKNKKATAPKDTVDTIVMNASTKQPKIKSDKVIKILLSPPSPDCPDYLTTRLKVSGSLVGLSVPSNSGLINSGMEFLAQYVTKPKNKVKIMRGIRAMSLEAVIEYFVAIARSEGDPKKSKKTAMINTGIKFTPPSKNSPGFWDIKESVNTTRQAIDNVVVSSVDIKQVTDCLLPYLHCTGKDEDPNKVKVDYIHSLSKAELYEHLNRVFLCNGESDDSEAQQAVPLAR